MKESLKEQYDYLFKMKWTYDDRFSMIFLLPAEVEKLETIQSNLRRAKYASVDFLAIIRATIKIGRNRHNEFKEFLRNQPRRDAQKFIGNKKIRQKVFKKYGKICLCCSSLNDITIDHIKSIWSGGLNIFDNLQPLCRGCNSSKGTDTIDYRS